MTNRSDPDHTGRKQATGRFRQGYSGNPHGRPKGSRNLALVALDAIGNQAAEDILRTVIAAARAGDLRAAEMLLSRLWPPRRDRPISLHLPVITTAADVATAMAGTVAAVADGSVTPAEGQSIAALLETLRRAIETADLEARLQALEAAAGQENGPDRG